MPVSLIDLLTGSARQALPFLEQLAETSLSSNEILRQLGEAGLGIRRQTGLDILSILRGKTNVQRYARTVGPNVPLETTFYTPSITPTRKNFTFRVKVENAPPGTPRAINISSDVPLSVNDIFSSAQSYLSGESGGFAYASGDLTPQLSLDRATVSPNAPPTIGFGAPFGGEGFGHGA